MPRLILPHEYLSFFVRMALLLSCYIILSFFLYPWDYSNFMIQRIPYMWLSTPTILSSVEIRVLVFCLLELLFVALLHSHIIPTEWIFVSGCTLQAALIHHIIMIYLFASSGRGVFTVTLMYLIQRARFLWSSILC